MRLSQKFHLKIKYQKLVRIRKSRRLRVPTTNSKQSNKQSKASQDPQQKKFIKLQKMFLKILKIRRKNPKESRKLKTLMLELKEKVKLKELL